MIVCLIPARIGSKRIKKKNILSFLGKPLIAYPISTAIKSKLFNKIIVSTDSVLIKKTSEKYGASVPFLRPKKLSTDNIPDRDVLKHFLKYAKENKMKIKYLCYLYPTATLMTVPLLKECYKIISKKKYGKLINTCKFPSNIERALKKDNTNKMTFNNTRYRFSRSQNMPDHYYDAGQCYWYKFKNNSLLFNEKMPTYGKELNHDQFVDINTHNDIKILKKLFDKNKK